MANDRAEVRKIAEAYVQDQLKTFDGKVRKRDVSQAVSKVSKAISEIRAAYLSRGSLATE